MDNKEKGVDFKKYIIILKKATRTVQLIPFAYTVFYIAVLISYSFASEPVLKALDTIFFVSPLCMSGMLILSKVLHLCNWHRMACILPLIPQVFSFIDYYIINLTEIEAASVNWIIIAMSILLLISAYKVFFANGRKEITV